MPKAKVRHPIYRQMRFPAEMIETCVRWYITYGLSYRDLVNMMAERGITVSHTIMRWVLRSVPEYEARWGRYARPVHNSWRMDETAVSAQAFFEQAVTRTESGWPGTVKVDGHAATHCDLCGTRTRSSDQKTSVLSAS